jgi:hypothetical protein
MFDADTRGNVDKEKCLTVPKILRFERFAVSMKDLPVNW